MDAPLLSVVMPTHGHAQFIETAIKGILSQTYPRVKLLVVSVKGDEQTRKVLDRLGVKYLESDRADHIHQINIGVNETKGEWVSAGASDDSFLPSKLWSELALATQRDALVVYSDFFYGDDQLRVDGVCRAADFSYERLIGRCMVNDCSLVSRGLYEEFGPLNEALGSIAFFDRWLHIAEKYPDKIVHNPYPAFIYRRHSGQKSGVEKLQDPKRLGLMLQVARASLKRKGLDAEQFKGYRVVRLDYARP